MRRAMIAAAVFVTVIGAVLALFWALQHWLMYFPTAHLPTPAEIGLTPVEPVTFETADGLKLSGWFLAASGPFPRLTVLVFNGNVGNRGYRGPLAAALHRHGLQVLLFDYRGYGGSPGSPTETGLAADGRAARAYLLGRSDVDGSRLVYFGESLGAAVAVGLAVEHPPTALILRSPFTSMADVGTVSLSIPAGPAADRPDAETPADSSPRRGDRSPSGTGWPRRGAGRHPSPTSRPRTRGLRGEQPGELLGGPEGLQGHARLFERSPPVAVPHQQLAQDIR